MRRTRPSTASVMTATGESASTTTRQRGVESERIGESAVATTSAAAVTKTVRRTRSSATITSATSARATSTAATAAAATMKLHANIASPAQGRMAEALAALKANAPNATDLVAAVLSSASVAPVARIVPKKSASVKMLGFGVGVGDENAREQRRLAKSFAFKALATLASVAKDLAPSSSARSAAGEKPAPAALSQPVRRVQSVSSLKSGAPRVVKQLEPKAISRTPNTSLNIVQISSDCGNFLKSLEYHEASLHKDFLDVTSTNALFSYWNFEVEKAVSNIITRLVDSQHPQEALILLKWIHSKLSYEPALPDISKLVIDLKVPVARNSVSSKVRTRQPTVVKDASVTMHSSKGLSNLSASTTSENAIIPKASFCLLTIFSSDSTPLAVAAPAAEDQPAWMAAKADPKCAIQPPPSLIVATLFNALRCQLLKDNEKIPFDLLIAKDGLLSWCVLLKSTDAVVGAKMADNVFRYLHKLAAGTADPDTSFNFKWASLRFFLLSTSFTQEMFDDLSMRAAIVYDKAGGSNIGNQARLFEKFYIWLLDVMETQSKSAPTLKRILLVDHCVSVAKKSLICNLNARANVFGRQICQTVMEENPNNPTGLLAAGFIASIETEAIITDADLCGHDLEEDVSLVSAHISEFARNLQASGLVLDASQKPQMDLLTDLSRMYCRILEACRNAAGALHLDSSVTDRVVIGLDHGVDVRERAIQVKRIFMEAVSCFAWWLKQAQHNNASLLPHVKNTQQSTHPVVAVLKRVLPNVVHLYMSVFTIELKFGDVIRAREVLLNATETVSVLHFVEGMWWIATAYYNVGSERFKAGEFNAALGWLTASCQALHICVKFTEDAVMDATETRKVLAKRYEALALCHGALSDFTNCIDACKNCFLYWPEDLFSDREWSADSPVRRMVDKILKMLASVKGNATLINLLPEHFSMSSSLFLLDYELEYLLDAVAEPKSDSDFERDTRRAAANIDSILELTASGLNSVKRARMYLHRANMRRLSKSKDFAAAISDVQQAVEILKSQAGDFESLNLVYDHLAVAYVTLGTCYSETGSLETKPLHLAYQIWKRLLMTVPQFPAKAIPECVEARKSFDSIEKTYSSLACLSELFGALNQAIHQICTLRLMLKLQLLRDPSTVNILSESIRIYSCIGYAYVAVGYTGKAGQALLQAQQLIESSKVNNSKSIPDSVISMWRLFYAYYLCSVGNAEKGLSVFDKCLPSDEISFETKSDAIVFASFSTFVKSNLLFFKGSLANAILESQRSVRYMSKALATSSFGEASRTFSSRWQCTQRFLEYHAWLGTLFSLRGSVGEAEYYFKQGLKIAESCHSLLFTNRFAMCLGELNYRRDLLEASRQNLAIVHSVAALGDNSVRENVESLMRKGDLSVKEGDVDQAMLLYDQANQDLEKAMAESSILKLENFANNLIIPGTPREQSLLHIVSPRKNVRELYADAKMGEAHLQCYILAFLKMEITSRMAWVLNLQGKIDEAEKRLFAFEDSPQRGLEQADYLCSLAAVKFKKLYQSLTGNPLLEMFADSAFSLPWCTPSKSATASSKSSRKGTSSVILERSIQQLEELLMEAVQCAKLYGAPNSLFQTCRQMALLKFIRGYLSGGVLEPMAKDLAISAVFYLDQCNGITSKREKFSELQERNVSPGGSGDESELGIISLHAAYEKEISWKPEDLSSQVIERLPATWTVVSLSADPNLDDLYVTRIRKDSTPAIFRLPMKRQAIREGEDNGFGLEALLTELHSIVSENNNTTKVAASVAAENRDQTREEKSAWWATRRELDDRMKDILTQLEKYWLGGFKGLLIGDDFNNANYAKLFTDFKTSLEHLIVKAVAKKSRVKPLPLDADLCHMILRLGPEPDPMDVEDVLYYLMDAYQYAGCPIGYDEVNIDMMESTLSESISRFHTGRQEIMKNLPIAGNQLNCTDRNHLILILDKNLQSLPWENIPCLRGTSVSRLPSFAFLRDRLDIVPKVVDRSSAFYVLNPSKDLINTANEFSGFVQENHEWVGVIDDAPTDEIFEKELQSKDMMLYFGHGGAEQYIRGYKIRKLDRCAVSFLMGCSSGRLTAPGEFDVAGTALNYLIAGCHSLVANLWDVTDRDIDRFSKSMFKKLHLAGSQTFPVEKKRRTGLHSTKGPEDDEFCMESRFFREEPPLETVDGKMSICEAAAVSRNACELKYLIGAAPVVYGIPVFVSSRE
ncbi:peptidase family C50-domain-containing protein [Chytriomyces sp. MP71]|nr:peptidase family C50-domain-containing protein [Chytriomyces sp. MP71]